MARPKKKLPESIQYISLEAQLQAYDVDFYHVYMINPKFHKNELVLNALIQAAEAMSTVLYEHDEQLTAAETDQNEDSYKDGHSVGYQDCKDELYAPVYDALDDLITAIELEKDKEEIDLIVKEAKTLIE